MSHITGKASNYTKYGMPSMLCLLSWNMKGPIWERLPMSVSSLGSPSVSILFLSFTIEIILENSRSKVVHVKNIPLESSALLSIWECTQDKSCMYALSVERPSLVVHTLLNTEFILEKTVKCMELKNPSTAVVTLKKKHPESLTERNPTYTECLLQAAEDSHRYCWEALWI